MSWKNWMCGLAIFAAACGGNEEAAQQEANELAAQLEQSINMAAEQVAAQAVEQAREAPTAAAEQAAAPAGEQAAQGLQQLGAALGEALQAAGMAQGGEPCEVAYNGMTAMIAALQKSAPNGMTNPVPSRDQYMAACRQLPEDAQQCSVPAYAMANMETCQAVMQRPEVRAKIEELRALVQASPQ
jgi:type VI protein secretion system component VasK